MEARRESTRKSVLLSSLGEVVEWFDFMVYLSLAPVLARVFFSADNRTSLLATLGVFAAAFVARPFGALLFGHLGDRAGRKKALVLSALLMAGTKIIEGSLPSYATAGLAAPVAFVLARMLSGISLGGEFTGTFVMLFESSRDGRRGLTTSLANVMAGTGVLLASGLVTLLTANLSDAAMADWGWRIPFFAGSLIGLVALAIHVFVNETPAFEKLRHSGKISRAPLRDTLRKHPRAILLAFAFAGYNALTYYLVVAFVPVYLESYVHVDHATAMLVATIASGFNVLFILLPGWLSDKAGRKPVLVAGCLGFAFLSYPLFTLLSSGHLAGMIIAALGFVILAACFMAPAMTSAMEHFPTEVRYSGFALGYNLGAGLFGGITPFVAAWLVHLSGNVRAPAFYLIAASVFLLVVIRNLRETSFEKYETDHVQNKL